MTDQAPASQTHPSRGATAATEPRKPFAAPVVEDLGRLQALTQQFGGSI